MIHQGGAIFRVDGAQLRGEYAPHSKHRCQQNHHHRPHPPGVAPFGGLEGHDAVANRLDAGEGGATGAEGAHQNQAAGPGPAHGEQVRAVDLAEHLVLLGRSQAGDVSMGQLGQAHNHQGEHRRHEYIGGHAHHPGAGAHPAQVGHHQHHDRRQTERHVIGIQFW